MTGFSRGEIDRLGERLRDADEPTREDLEMLARHQQSFRGLRDRAWREAARAAGPRLGQVYAFREKQLYSIVRKLKRGSTRLSQLQDIVGFRLVVPDILVQEEILRGFSGPPAWQLVDRRAHPVAGYRAVHLIRREGIRRVEFQLRTQLQHAWAELSESWDRRVEGVKYGLGPPQLIRSLADLSDLVRRLEGLELHGAGFAHRGEVEALRGEVLELLAGMLVAPEEPT